MCYVLFVLHVGLIPNSRFEYFKKEKPCKSNDCEAFLLLLKHFYSLTSLYVIGNVVSRIRLRCFTNAAALLHEYGCVNRWDTSRLLIKVPNLMQDMQASFNYLLISWFWCICSMQMCCKTCKFTDLLAILATHFFSQYAIAINYESVS